MSPARGPIGTRAVCVAILITGVATIAACTNDFDALFDGPNVAGTDGRARADEPATTCAARTCEAKLDRNDDNSEVYVADECCSYGTTCANARVGVCALGCSSGALCKSLCETQNVCQFDVSDRASADLVCRSTLCNVDCKSGATCRVDCTESDDCRVTCDGTSTCLVRGCEGARCVIECAGGKPPQDCGDGTKSCGGCK